MIVSGEPVARFVSQRVGFGLCPPYTAMGIERDGGIAGGVIFNQFENSNVHVTVAGKYWTRAFLRAAGEYAFGQLGCLRVTITTEQSSVIALAQKLGGQIEGRMRNHFGEGRDGIIVGILKSEYRYAKVTMH